MTLAETPDFLDISDVMDIHTRGLADAGGSPGIRDAGLLESAIAQPQQSFAGLFVHQDIFLMAAAYAFHIAQNQPFIDGNKRAALGAALTFLDLNGIELDDPEGRLHLAMLAIAEKSLDKAGLGELLRTLSRSET